VIGAAVDLFSFSVRRPGLDKRLPAIERVLEDERIPRQESPTLPKQLGAQPHASSHCVCARLPLPAEEGGDCAARREGGVRQELDEILVKYTDLTRPRGCSTAFLRCRDCDHLFPDDEYGLREARNGACHRMHCIHFIDERSD
jgi:hypothetical protein